MDCSVQFNRAVLVSVSHFTYGVNLSPRRGAEKDTKRLHRILTNLGFKVAIHNDLESHDIYALFEKECRLPVKECFLAVFSSHGEEGCVFGADGRPVQLARIFSYFDHANMEQKIKLFFVQACRGSELDDGVEVDSAVSTTTEDSFAHYLSVPVNTAVMYATTPGYGAFNSPLGAVFLQTLCTLLEEEDCRNMELTRLLTRLSHHVAYTFQAKGRLLAGKKEMPCFLTRLTREVFLFAKPLRNTGVTQHSATSLVGADTVRKVTPPSVRQVILK